MLSPVSIQTQSLALRALRKRKPQETQALAVFSFTQRTQLKRLRLNGNQALVVLNITLCYVC